jgi:hypothetical protein
VIGSLSALLAILVVGVGDAPSAGGTAPVPRAPDLPGPTVTPILPATPTGPPTGTADDLPIAISWSAPAECPGIDAVKTEVRRVAGPVPPPAEPLAADVMIRRGAGTGWLLTLVTRAGTRAGERRLAGADCTELMHAAALVLALMINPEASFIAEPPPPPAPPPPPPPPPEPERHFAIGVDVVVGSGALPGFAGAFGVRLAAGAAALSGELRGSIWPSRSIASANDRAAGGTFDLIDGSAAGCARARHDETLSPGVCAGASLVRLHGRGYGVGYPADTTAWWTAAFAEANLRARLSPLNAVRVAAQVVVPVGRPSFELAGVGQVFEPATIWLRGTLGWELHF